MTRVASCCSLVTILLACESNVASEAEPPESSTAADSVAPQTDTTPTEQGEAAIEQLGSGAFHLSQSARASGHTESSLQGGFALGPFGNLAFGPATTRALAPLSGRKGGVETSAGGCVQYDYRAEPNVEPAPQGPLPEFIDAGSVSITGLPGEPALVADGSTKIYSAASDAAWWLGGETATLTGGGTDTVPAFQLDFELPAAVTASTPTPDTDGSYSVSRSDDLVVEWESSGAARVLFGISALEAGLVFLLCQSNLSKGSLTVDASLLTNFEGPGEIFMLTSTTTIGYFGAWTVSVIADALPIDGSVVFTD